MLTYFFIYVSFTHEVHITLLRKMQVYNACIQRFTKWESLVHVVDTEEWTTNTETSTSKYMLNLVIIIQKCHIMGEK